MEPHGPHPNLLPSPAITLRPFVHSDADALMSWASDPRVTCFQRRAPYTHTEEAEDFILHHILPHPWYRAICVAGDSSPVGSISVQAATGFGADHRASLGYRVAYDWWGRGVATAAVKAAAEEVFSDWPQLVRLEAVADVENPASQRVLEKSGFVKEGVLRKYIVLKGEPRDMVMYSLLSMDA